MKSRAAVIHVTALLLLVLAAAGCTSTPPSGTVSAAGGEVALPSDPRVAVVVPQGAAPNGARVVLSVDDDAPQPNPGTVPLGDAVDIRPDVPLPGAQVRLPVDLAQLAPSQDFAIFVYSETLHLWIPLPTDWDGAGSASATTPHFSRFRVFSFDIGDAAAGAAVRVGDAAHDAYSGVRNFAGGIISGMHAWWEGDQEELDCGRAITGWSVTSEAVETSGCVVDDGGPELRLRSTYRVPFAVAGTAGMDVELSDGDFELGLIEFVSRRLNAALGLGSLTPQGTTTVGVPEGLQEEGATVPYLLVPDKLSTAWRVIDSVLSFLPNKKTVTEQVDRVVLTTIWEQQGSAVTVTTILDSMQVAMQRTVTDSEALDSLKTVIAAWKCASEYLEAGGTTAQEQDPRSTAEEVVEVVKECTGQVLKAADSGMTAIWDTVTGSVDGVQAFRQTADLVKVGFTHWAGEIDVTAERTGPMTLGVSIGGYARGFGEVRPEVIDRGGPSSTGLVEGIAWTSWGGDQAEGSGSAAWVPPGLPNAFAERHPATVVAFDPGECDGKRVYRRFDSFFPQFGESFEPDNALNMCTNDFD